MPLPNRVTPYGRPTAVAARGTLFGNRGVLHDRDQRIVRFSQGTRWISCVLSFQGRRRVPMTPGRYTELFFLDEATALAAGHRPCMECRRGAALAFRAAWARATGADPTIRFGELDRILHEQRLAARGRMRRWTSPLGALPDRVMIDLDGAAMLRHGAGLLRWTPTGYEPAAELPGTRAVTVLTPPDFVAALRGGYRPAPHPSVPTARPGAVIADDKF